MVVIDALYSWFNYTSYRQPGSEGIAIALSSDVIMTSSIRLVTSYRAPPLIPWPSRNQSNNKISCIWVKLSSRFIGVAARIVRIVASNNRVSAAIDSSDIVHLVVWQLELLFVY